MKKIYKLKGMDCPSCAMLVESELEDVGIKASVSYAKQILEVENIKNTSYSKISKIVSGLGYQLEN